MTPVAGLGDELRRVVTRAVEGLRGMAPEEAARPRQPGKWSPAQIIGHLVDSASNNHQRFVRARFRGDLRFDGYEQDAWVDAQGYASAPWSELVDLWTSFNLHLARVMATTPEDVLRSPRPDHNLDSLAWEPLPAEEPATLEYFMRDYIGHLRHHLRQIDPALADPPKLQRPGKIYPQDR
jgi:hypothetical protein